MRTRLARAALLCMLTLAALPAAANGQSLTGEKLSGNSFTRPSPVFEVTSKTCNLEGDSTISYRSEGTAVGPYPGTYTETGTVTIGPHEFLGPGPTGTSGPVTAFTAEFEIVSGDTTITGTKTGGSPVHEFANRGLCFVFEEDTPTFHTKIETYAFVTSGTYEARIESSDGCRIEEGTTQLNGTDQTVDSDTKPSTGTPIHNDLLGFFESFATTSERECAPELPTSAGECAGDGWRSFGVFKNRGDCVSFVATGGRNEPGKNVPG